MLLNQMNRIMTEVATTARRQVQQQPDADLTTFWVTAIERLSSSLFHRELSFPKDISTDSLKVVCKGKPWSYERFVDFVKQRP
jgi:hypothetical protein